MCLSEFSNYELVALASAISISIGKEFSKEDIIILSTFFTAVGDNLAILSLDE